MWRNCVTKSICVLMQGMESPGLRTMEYGTQQVQLALLFLLKHTDLLPQHLRDTDQGYCVHQTAAKVPKVWGRSPVLVA